LLPSPPPPPPPPPLPSSPVFSLGLATGFSPRLREDRLEDGLRHIFLRLLAADGILRQSVCSIFWCWCYWC
ncbi:unnamed protein product, partial [Laminaria digitata]